MREIFHFPVSLETIKVENLKAEYFLYLSRDCPQLRNQSGILKTGCKTVLLRKSVLLRKTVMGGKTVLHRVLVGRLQTVRGCRSSHACPWQEEIRKPFDCRALSAMRAILCLLLLATRQDSAPGS